MPRHHRVGEASAEAQRGSEHEQPLRTRERTHEVQKFQRQAARYHRLQPHAERDGTVQPQPTRSRCGEPNVRDATAGFAHVEVLAHQQLGSDAASWKDEAASRTPMTESRTERQRSQQACELAES